MTQLTLPIWFAGTITSKLILVTLSPVSLAQPIHEERRSSAEPRCGDANVTPCSRNPV